MDKAKLSQNALFMLLWIGDPEQLSQQLGYPVPHIRATQIQILNQQTKQKHNFPTPKAEQDALTGINELKQKGLITTDRYDDIWLTDKGTYMLGTRKGIFPNTDKGTYFI